MQGIPHISHTGRGFGISGFQSDRAEMKAQKNKDCNNMRDPESTQLVFVEMGIENPGTKGSSEKARFITRGMQPHNHLTKIRKRNPLCKNF